MAHCKEDYQFFKSLGLCSDCGKVTVAKGVARCPDCQDKQYTNHIRYMQKRYPNSTNPDSARRKEQSYQLIEQGMCTRCFKPNSDDNKGNKWYCKSCRDKRNAHYRLMGKIKHLDGIKRGERASYGICTNCNSTELYNGTKVCKSCYDKLKKAREINQSRYDNSNHIWRKLDKFRVAKAN